VVWVSILSNNLLNGILLLSKLLFFLKLSAIVLAKDLFKCALGVLCDRNGDGDGVNVPLSLSAYDFKAVWYFDLGFKALKLNKPGDLKEGDIQSLERASCLLLLFNSLLLVLCLLVPLRQWVDLEGEVLPNRWMRS